ncbi:MAG: hypothetical protein QNJ54_36850 [Prochloraceae cyanobacterium]|nr:hypothetical protein [Prochloraceae cyanobacterium]
MGNKAFDEYLGRVEIKSLGLKRLPTYLVVLLLSLIVLLYGCGASVVYQDRFDSTPVGSPPGPPEIGISRVSGQVLIAENPINDVSPDRWLQLKRVSPVGTLAEYVGQLESPVTAGGNVALVGYIPAFAPITMSVYFDTPDFAPPLTLLHIDLLADGQIRVNDSTVEGTYEFDTSIAFLVGFNLDASTPTATLLVRGGAEDASATVEIPAAAAGFGLGRVRILTPFEGVSSPPGQFFINEVVATRGSG